jgi:cytoskeletal protein RodZ
LYARAFLVEYARYLQADPRPLLAAFAPGTDVEDAGPALPPRPRAPFVVPSWAMLATALTLLVVGLAVAGGRLPDGAFAHAARTITSTGPRAPSAPARVLAEHTVAPVTSFTVVISVAGAPCWLRVTVDGTPALERTVLPGQTQTFASRHEIDLLVGNASAVGLMVNGQVLPSLGNAGQVRALRILLVDGAVRVEPGAA